MFRSFFMAGFECATGFNRGGNRIDQVAATEHDVQLKADYDRVRRAGINVVREGVRWPLVDNCGEYDFSTLNEILVQAQSSQVQLILDLFHYGYPEDLDIFSPQFVDRFASYCHAVAVRVKRLCPGPYFFTPVNEPSFFAWAAGDAARFRPHETGRSFELKIQLARAAIRGIDEILSVLPTARIINVDPLCRVAVSKDRPETHEDAHHFNENVVFQSWDMLSGRIFPELGGSDRHLDILGLNYYWTNQWEHLSPESPLAGDDERLWPLRDLVRWVWRRYGHEMIISESAQIGELRANWILEAANEVEAVLNEGIPLQGFCLYPVLGMPEWHNPTVWARMGLWDLIPGPVGLERVPHSASLSALAEVQMRLEGLNLEPIPVPRPMFLL
jgi:beta-glucosidase/6-phospho-beta-glucosidase/beta-galactosidase